ncbi:MAG TPA: peptidylprolyl isomerase [Gemmatimonadaceae bacterium]|jgi:peptidyl-prolyl cis-trans isomerase SurA|nr:peptidylprolyl isomerase [Gemmatimonadaceae bacterium]
MKHLLASSFLVVAAGTLSAQQPAAPSSPAALDAIVAVVGDQPITRFDLQERVLGKIQRKEVKEPTSDSASRVLYRDVLSDMVEEELLIQKAKELKVEATDAEITPMVDRQVREIKSQFPTETEFRNALAKSSLGTPEEYRKFLLEQYRRQSTLEKTIRKLMQDGKIVPVNVGEAEINAAFEREKDFLPPKPASVTFKQIVIAPKPTAASKEAARVKAESLLAQLKSGSDFEKLAKRESMDPLTRETGGDLGWARRDQNLPQFDIWLFGGPFQTGLQPGQLSPVVETPYGYHIIRVDRRQTGEVKAHQILIMPKLDSTDFARTQKLADSVAAAWKAGASFDSLAKKFHDYAGKEETSLLTPFWRDSLPVSYQKAFTNRKAGDIVTFQIPGSSQRPDVPKFVVAQLQTVDEGGAQTLAELRPAVRDELARRGGVRRYVDGLKKQTYVSIRLDALGLADATKPAP